MMRRLGVRRDQPHILGVVVTCLVFLEVIAIVSSNGVSVGLYSFGGARTSYDDNPLPAASQPAGEFRSIGPTIFVPRRGFVVAAKNSFSGIVSKHPLSFNTSLELAITALYEHFSPAGDSGSTVYAPTLMIRILASASDEWSGGNINELEPLATVQIRQLRTSGTSYVRATSNDPSASAECNENIAPSVGGLRMVLASATDEMAVAWWRDADANASADSTLAEICNGYPSDNGWIAGPSQKTLANTSIYIAVGFDTYYGSLPYNVTISHLAVSQTPIRTDGGDTSSTTFPLSTDSVSGGTDIATTSSSAPTSLPDFARNGTVFPSIGAAWALPGVASTPTYPRLVESGFSSPASVEEWEWQHADITMGGATGRSPLSIGYMYNQILSYDPASLEFFLRFRSVQHAQEVSTQAGLVSDGAVFENFTLHFDVDTMFEMAETYDPTDATETSLYGVPFIVGYTGSQNHAGFYLYQPPPWAANVFSGVADGGALFVLSSERFDALQVDLRNSSSTHMWCNGTLTAWYVSSVSTDRRRAKNWSMLGSQVKVSNNTVQPVRVHWNVPADWYIATLNDGTHTYNGGQVFGRTDLLAESGLVFAVKLQWTSDENQCNAPLVDDVTHRRWIAPVFNTSSVYPSYQNATFGRGLKNSPFMIIPGWNPQNDANGDGYVDDVEFARRPFAQASARMRHEARAAPLGQMWSAHSAWCIRNVWDPLLRDWVAEYTRDEWARLGLAGAYNDDLFKLVGPHQFKVIHGGNASRDVAAYGFESNFVDRRMQSVEYNFAFTDGFTMLLDHIGQFTGSRWITANVGAETLYKTHQRRVVAANMRAFICEDLLRPLYGMTGYIGFQKLWNTFALAAAGKDILLQAQLTWTSRNEVNNSRESWDADLETSLVQAYLLHVPNRTFVEFWGNSFLYGSANSESHNFWVDGVPLNMAYQPTEMMKIDIGVPAPPSDVDSREFMEYQTSTSTPLSGYTSIGSTRESVLRHAELGTVGGPSGEVPVVPSYVFYLYRSDFITSTIKSPSDCVLARNFTKGLVVLRVSTFGNSASFLAAAKLTVQLNQTYRRVRLDGSLGPCITNISLGGYEGAVLVAEAHAADALQLRDEFKTQNPIYAPVEAFGTTFSATSDVSTYQNSPVVNNSPSSTNSRAVPSTRMQAVSTTASISYVHSTRDSNNASVPPTLGPTTSALQTVPTSAALRTEITQFTAPVTEIGSTAAGRKAVSSALNTRATVDASNALPSQTNFRSTPVGIASELPTSQTSETTSSLTSIGLDEFASDSLTRLRNTAYTGDVAVASTLVAGPASTETPGVHWTSAYTSMPSLGSQRPTTTDAGTKASTNSETAIVGHSTATMPLPVSQTNSVPAQQEPSTSWQTFSTAGRHKPPTTRSLTTIRERRSTDWMGNASVDATSRFRTTSQISDPDLSESTAPLLSSNYSNHPERSTAAYDVNSASGVPASSDSLGTTSPSATSTTPPSNRSSGLDAGGEPGSSETISDFVVAGAVVGCISALAIVAAVTTHCLKKQRKGSIKVVPSRAKNISHSEPVHVSESQTVSA